MQRAASESNWPMRAVIAVAVLIAFGASLGGQFVGWDDHDLITQNPKVNPPTVAGLMQLWHGPDHQMYIPVVYTTWWTLAHVPAESSATMFHAANVILQLLSAWMVFAILSMLVKSRWAACAGAMIFAVHPLQTEAVAWATGLKDVLSGFFAIAAIWQWLRARSGRSSWGYAVASVEFVLALLSKPSTVCVPVICIVLDWLNPQTPSPGTPGEGRGEGVSGELTSHNSRLTHEDPHPNPLPEYRERGSEGWFVVTIWCALGTIAAFVAAKVQPIPAGLATPWLSRPLIAADSLMWYLTKLFWPVGLAADYSRTPTAVLNSGFAKYEFIFIAAMLAVVAIGRRRASVAVVALFIVALGPVLGLTPFVFQKYSTVADRYAYLAMLAPALACAAVLARFDPRKWIAPAALVSAVLIVLSVRQTLLWHDTLSLFTHTLDVNPTSLAGTRSLGFYWAEHHDDAQAAAYFEAANRLHPEDSTNHFNYANLFLRHGMLEAALAHYQAAVTIDPANAQYELNYGVALASAGQTADALVAFQKASDLNPSSADAWQNVGLACEKLGRTDAARQAFTRALACDPSRAVAREHLSHLP